MNGRHPGHRGGEGGLKGRKGTGTKWRKETHCCRTRGGWPLETIQAREKRDGRMGQPQSPVQQYPEVSHACHWSPRRRGERGNGQKRVESIMMENIIIIIRHLGNPQRFGN